MTGRERGAILTNLWLLVMCIFSSAWLQKKNVCLHLFIFALMMTGAFSQNIDKSFSKLKLVTDNLLFIYAEDSWEATESVSWGTIDSYLPMRGWIKGTINAIQHCVQNGGHVFPFDVWYMPWSQARISLWCLIHALALLHKYSNTGKFRHTSTGTR